MSRLHRPATVVASAGGDWYHVIALPEDQTLIAIGDVADHGAVAIGEMSRFRFTAQAFAAAGFEPAEVVHRTDELLVKTATSQATVVLAVLDDRSSVLTWTTAGHPFPVVIDRHGEITVLAETHGAPLGTGFTQVYGTQERRLEPGDTLVLDTDGLIERPDEGPDESTRRLVDALEQLRGPSTSQTHCSSTSIRMGTIEMTSPH